jgi:UDPglucose 6-dehydrogenase
MASVGWIGLGRLGAPCAAALSHHGGHQVWGYDVRGGDDVTQYTWESLPPIELTKSVDDVVTETDGVVFVAVQTPHAPAYGGETPTPDEPRDFEYGYLVNAVRAVARAALTQRKPVTLVVVSTVLPGTFNRELRPLLNRYVTPVYHPFFIAMGTVVEDFIQPELTLFGVDERSHAQPVLDLYTFHGAPTPIMPIASAELTKVAYNTFISMKIVYANTVAEMCEATGADVDDVTDALRHATDRIISDRYLRAGMGDGGACHPRDNVALSALARRYDLSVDLMGFLTTARERQTDRLAALVQRWRDQTNLPVIVLGRSYKPNVEFEDGSPALLLSHYLLQRAINYIHVTGWSQLPESFQRRSAVFVLATAHDELRDVEWPARSVVIDPFGVALPPDDVTLVTPGRRRG